MNVRGGLTQSSRQEPQQGAGQGALVLGGAHGSLAIARSLGRRGVPVWVLTADNRLATLSRFVARSLSWPGPGEAGAVGFLVDLGRRHGLGGWVLFAGSDEDVRFVAQNHAALGTVFTLTTPIWDRLRWACDKRFMNARADELGIAHPLTRYPRTGDDLADLDLPFPVILKPTVRENRNAFVDAKAWRADDARSLRTRYKEAASLVRADQIMVQELIPGGGAEQFSYAAVWDRGVPIGSLVARRQRQYPIEFGFTSTLVETIELPEIAATAARFLTSLDYSGLVEIEFKYDARDRSYKILDVNARAWTWIALGAAAGVDFPALQWRLASGERVAPASARRDVRWVFASRDIVAAAQEMLTGKLSPTEYIRSWRRCAASAVYAWDDPWPAVLDLPLVAMRVASRWLSRRNRAAARALQSARLPS
jgi:predicted ATP-grasp superfamily ATP-dependent carboligase